MTEQTNGIPVPDVDPRALAMAKGIELTRFAFVDGETKLPAGDCDNCRKATLALIEQIAPILRDWAIEFVPPEGAGNHIPITPLITTFQFMQVALANCAPTEGHVPGARLLIAKHVAQAMAVNFTAEINRL